MRTLVALLRKGAALKHPPDTGNNAKIRAYLGRVFAAGGVEAYDLRRATTFANTMMSASGAPRIKASVPAGRGGRT